MDLETIKIPIKIKKDEFLGRLNLVRNDYNSLSKLVRQIKENFEISKKASELLKTGEKNKEAEFKYENLIQKEVFEQNLNVENSKRKMIEMESISLTVLDNLHQNNENLLRINNNVCSLNKEVDNGSATMNRIFRKENKNKLTVFALSFILLVIFVLIIIFRYQDKKSD